MGKLANKVAVITGGNSGIGYATAEEFIANGARVVITGKNEQAVQEAAASLGNDTIGVLADVSDLAAIDRLRDRLQKEVGQIDVLFVNAGLGEFAPIEYVEEQSFDRVFNVNVKGAYFTIQKLLPLFNPGGSIIINASISAYLGRPNYSVYAASKAAVISLAKSFASELVDRGIRVNVVSPGPTKTPIFYKNNLSEEAVEQAAEAIRQEIPIKRLGRPEEIAKAVLFFASDDSSFVLGAELIADGGMSTL